MYPFPDKHLPKRWLCVTEVEAGSVPLVNGPYNVIGSSRHESQYYFYINAQIQTISLHLVQQQTTLLVAKVMVNSLIKMLHQVLSHHMDGYCNCIHQIVFTHSLAACRWPASAHPN